MRLHWFAVSAVVIIGCESLRNPPAPPTGRLADRAAPVAPPEIHPAAATVAPAALAAQPPQAVAQTDSLTLAAENLERGSHAELIALGGRYRQLYDKQYRLERNRYVNPGEELVATV